MVHALLFIGGKAKGEVTYSLIFRRPRVNKWVVIVTFEEEPLIGQIENLHNTTLQLNRNCDVQSFNEDRLLSRLFNSFSFPPLQKKT